MTTEKNRVQVSLDAIDNISRELAATKARLDELDATNRKLAATNATVAQTSAKVVSAHKAQQVAVVAAGRSIEATRKSLTALRGPMLLIGAQAAPRLTGAMFSAVAAMDAVRSISNATGLSLARVAARASGIVAVLASVGAIARAAHQTSQAQAAEAKSAKDLADQNNFLARSIKNVIDQREELGFYEKSRADDLRSQIPSADQQLSPELRSDINRDTARRVRADDLSFNRFLLTQDAVDAQRAMLVKIAETQAQISKARIAAETLDVNRAHQAGLIELDGFLARRRQLAVESNQAELSVIEQQEMQAKIDLMYAKNRVEVDAAKGHLRELAGQRKVLEYELQSELTQIATEGEQKRQADRERIARETQERIKAQLDANTFARQLQGDTLGISATAPGADRFGIERQQLEVEFEERKRMIEELAAHKANVSDAELALAEWHSARIVQIARDEMESRRAIQQQSLAVAADFFGGMAALSKSFGREGFEAYKTFATAQAVIDTYSAAIGAYQAMVGIPYVGPVLAGVAAAAAVAYGVAQVAAIQSQTPGYSSGGVVPGQYNGRDDRTIMVGPGEVILTPQQVQMIGVNHIMSALEVTGGKLYGGYGGLMPTSGTPRFATGGIAPPGAPSAGGVNIMFPRDRNDEREFLRMGSAHVIRDLRRRGNKVKV